jgi:hypothetical protein
MEVRETGDDEFGREGERMRVGTRVERGGGGPSARGVQVAIR